LKACDASALGDWFLVEVVEVDAGVSCVVVGTDLDVRDGIVDVDKVVGI
jgi:hypothetical protein